MNIMDIKESYEEDAVQMFQAIGMQAGFMDQ
jgi:hypothetical protein